jgi:hypothetical protein
MQVYEQLAETCPSFRRNQERINELTLRSIASDEAQKVTRPSPSMARIVVWRGCGPGVA